MTARRLAGLWGPVILQGALLFYLSSLRGVPVRLHNFDKAAHFVAYGILAVSCSRALHGGFTAPRAWPSVLAVLLTISYGVTDEIHQAFVPGRDASLEDVAADAAGAVTAVTFAALAQRIIPPARMAGRGDGKQ